VWQSIEGTDSCWRELHRPGCIPACHFSP
jgi:hypothetical protein